MCAQNEPFCVIPSAPLTTLIVQDLQVVRDIMITHFESFPDRGSLINPRDTLIFNLAIMNYCAWKPTRHKLTPAFSPAKLKMMFPTLLKVGEQFVEVIKDQLDGGVCEINIQDFCARFTMDVIGNVAFGIECNSLQYPETEFRVYGSQASDINIHPFLSVIGDKYPKLFKWFNLKTFKKGISDFVERTVRETLEYREKHNIRRNDFMDILIELQKGVKENDGSSAKFIPAYEMIVPQVFLFFLAGFEASASTMTYALYELAKNMDIQEKARDSIQDIMTKNGNKLTYDSLSDLRYLKQVIQETLRMYPINPTARRVCRRSCTLLTDKGPRTISAGTFVLIPIFAIHRNPTWYPQPEIFRPERFAESELPQRPAYSYMPFGIGPRACIGLRFAKMQVAFGLALLLTQFRFSVGVKTPADLVFDSKKLVFLTVKDGIYLKVERL